MTVDPVVDLKTRAIEADKRLYALEKNFAVATAIGLVFVGAFGASGLYYLPAKVKELVDKTAAGEATEAIRKLRSEAEGDLKEIAIITQQGKIKIGSTCFAPHALVRCVKNDHMTWIDNRQECETNGYKVDSPETAILVGGNC